MNLTYYEYRLSTAYYAFRALLALILIIVSIADYQFEIRGSYSTDRFAITCGIYITITFINLFNLIRTATTPSTYSHLLAIAIDVIFCLALMHFSGGFSSGLGILLLTPVAIAGIFFYGIFAFFIAALSSVGMLLDILYMTSLDTTQAKYFVPAGLLGVLFFITSFITQTIAKYIRATEEKAEESQVEIESLEQLNEKIVERIKTGIIVINHDNIIQTLNPIVQQYFATPLHAESALPVSISSLVNQWKDGTINLPITHQDHAGLPYIRLNFSYISTNNPKSNVIIFIENLSDLNQQAQHLKLASLGRLSASIAHEIRNPLSAIKHASQLMLESPKIDPQDTQLLNIIDQHTVRLNKIISNVLDLSRQAQSNPGKHSLRTIINKVTGQVTESLHHNIIIEVEGDDIDVPFDESQLLQILFNLINNAAHYSFSAIQEYKVRLAIGTDKDLPYLDIYDYGPGVPDENIEKIFEPFFTTNPKGTGLGLYIARELCVMNQAILDYISNGEKHFRITFSHPEKRITAENS